MVRAIFVLLSVDVRVDGLLAMAIVGSFLRRCSHIREVVSFVLLLLLLLMF